MCPHARLEANTLLFLSISDSHLWLFVWPLLQLILACLTHPGVLSSDSVFKIGTRFLGTFLFSLAIIFSLSSLRPWLLLLVLGLNPWSLLIMSMSHTPLTSYMIGTWPLISSFDLKVKIMLIILFRQWPLLIKKAALDGQKLMPKSIVIISPLFIYLSLKHLFNTHDTCVGVWYKPCCWALMIFNIYMVFAKIYWVSLSLDALISTVEYLGKFHCFLCDFNELLPSTATLAHELSNVKPYLCWWCLYGLPDIHQFMIRY